MSYFGAAVLTLFILGLTSAGWYYLFKRFERRMSSRFDDLVARNEETMKGFADTLEILGMLLHSSQEHEERIQRVIHDLEIADKKLDLIQGIALVIKQDQFLNHARAMERAYRENGKIDEQALDKLEKLLDEFKLENFSRY